MLNLPRRSFFKSLFAVPAAVAAIKAMPARTIAKPPGIMEPKGFSLLYFDSTGRGVINFEVAGASGIPEAGAEVDIRISGLTHRALITRVILKKDYTALVTASLLDPPKLNLPYHSRHIHAFAGASIRDQEYSIRS